MKLNGKKTFGILLSILLLAVAIAFAADSDKAMHPSRGRLFLDLIYLPTIYRTSSQVNPFGIMRYSFAAAAGLTGAVKAGASWNCRGITWSSIGPTELLDVSSLFIEFQQ